MALRAHPTILGDLAPKQAFKSDTTILHALSSGNQTLTLQYWITTRTILPMFTKYRQEAGYYVLYFTPFSAEFAWTHLYPEQVISNTISIRLNETNPPTFPSLASLISTSPTPTTPPTHIPWQIKHHTNQSLQFLPSCWFLVWCVGDRWGPYREATRPRRPLWGIMGKNTKSCSVCIKMGVCIMLTP